MGDGHLRAWRVATAAFTLLCMVASSAQQAAPLRFDVATVRRNNSGLNTTDFSMQPGGRFGTTNAPLREIIQIAYGVSALRLIAPDWTASERFDIVARKEGDPTRDELLGMVRELLVDRFGLVVHSEMREMPIYALVLARGDGSLGPRLRPATVDCAAIMAAAQKGAPLPPPRGRILCGRRGSPGRIEAGGLPMATIASGFSALVGRLVFDRTSLPGDYDFDLDYAPEVRDAATPPPAQRDAPSIFTAVQEQLGLRFESTRGAVDVLVVDKVERPSAD
jgi:uncharacterized protein (TIGR03435 family)